LMSKAEWLVLMAVPLDLLLDAAMKSRGTHRAIGKTEVAPR